MSFKYKDLTSNILDEITDGMDTVTCAGLSLFTFGRCILLSIAADAQRDSQLPVLMQQLRQTLDR